MQVEVNEANIDRYNLVELTGNSREFMLSEAANASANGHILSVNVPDDLVLEHNVFDVYESEHVDPRRLQGCGYEERDSTDGAKYLVCVLHGKTSRHDLSVDPSAPCLLIDPDPEAMKAALDQLSEQKISQPKVGSICTYEKKDDALDGTVYICKIHGKRSKYDVTRLPNMPCMMVDPMTPSEGDPHRP